MGIQQTNGDEEINQPKKPKDKLNFENIKEDLLNFLEMREVPVYIGLCVMAEIIRDFVNTHYTLS